ncbi:membrane protein [Streptomyces mashuensis]|uniref:Membrane protein n=1 Tax=Streptomyces mashuensis TaxID=33904 RepID=A0A919EFB9_9ACTN|nr:Bax inhibitor-1/YccA family protein [Streptomyces mashuensis]GHF64021.1 membrane protein [Streptomyces mashuensis]
MRSSNPVFSRRFGRDNGGYAGFDAGQRAGSVPQGAPYAGAHPYAQNPYAQQPANPYAQNPYAQGGPDLQTGYPQAPSVPGRMTMDDVVARTGMTLGLVVVAAAAAWLVNLPLFVGFGAMIVAAVLAIVQTFKQRPVPALILGYAAFEGLFLGVLSKAYNSIAAGAPMQAVLGTMAVFVGVLVAYRTGLIKVNRRFVGFVTAAAIGFVLLMLVNLMVGVFAGGTGLGLRSGAVGIGVGIFAVLLGAAFLALDFKQVEDGVRYGAPREESWFAAFGLTMSLVWIYVELLRLVQLLNQD